MIDRYARSATAPLFRLILALALAYGLLTHNATAASPPVAPAHGPGAASLVGVLAARGPLSAVTLMRTPGAVRLSNRLRLLSRAGGPQPPRRGTPALHSSVVGGSTPALRPFTMARRAGITPATTFAFTEGAPSGTTFLGTVIDYASCLFYCPYTVTIDAGDGSPPTTATVLGYTCYVGFFAETCVDVNAAYTYAEEGSYTIVATVADGFGYTVGTLTNAASVADAPLSASGLTLQASGGAINGTVATVSDADPGGTASDYVATINWGDGSPSTSGAIAASGSGGFSVGGTHTYANPSESYSVSISIADGGGSSATATTTVAPTIPDAPGNVSATAGAGAATVSWSPPASDGGSPITGYTVQTCNYAPPPPPPGGMPVRSGIGRAAITPDGRPPLVCGDPSVTVGASASSAQISGLSGGTAYQFSVAAMNAVGTGVSALSPQITVTVGLPGAPTALTATPGNATITVNWQPPSSDGGSSITSYTVSLTDTAGDSYMQSTAALSTTFSGLTDGMTYTVAVAATNALGSGPAVSATAVPSGPPTAPAVVTAFAGDTTAVVYWTPAATEGGSPVTGYTVQTCSYAASGGGGGTTGLPIRPGTGSAAITPNGRPPLVCGDPSLSVGPGATSAQITGLTDGTGYRFSVAALNAVSASSATLSNLSVSPNPATYAPGNLVATAGDGSTTLSWAPPAQSGVTPTSSYVTTLVDSAGDIYIQQITDLSNLSATFTGLTNGTPYTVAVAAYAPQVESPAAMTVVTPLGPPTTSPTATDTPSPTYTPTDTPTTTGTPTNTPTTTGTPTNTPTTTGTPTNTPTTTSTATNTPTDTPTATSTALPTNTATSTAPPTTTTTPTATSTAIPPSLVSSRASGSYRTTVTITGTNFGPSQPINVYWDSMTTMPLTRTSILANGSFTATFSVPQAISGTHSIIAVGQSSAESATVPFLVRPAAYLTHVWGSAGTVDVLLGSGFAAHETVRGYWNSFSTPPFTVTATTNDSGSFGLAASSPGITFTVPLSPTGAYVVYGVGLHSHAVAGGRFIVRPRLQVTPASGPAGSRVTALATGYGAHETVTLLFDCATSTCVGATALGTPATDATGAFSVGVTLPLTATLGAHNIGGKGGRSGAFATTAFTVTP